MASQVRVKFIGPSGDSLHDEVYAVPTRLTCHGLSKIVHTITAGGMAAAAREGGQDEARPAVTTAGRQCLRLRL